MKRLLLVRHAPTSATRAAAFPADERLDDSALARVAQLARILPSSAVALSSPAARCLETARAAGLDPRAEPALAECDFGSWAGRSLADVHAEDPDGAGAWMTDPDARPHGGESLTEFAARVAGWLKAQAQGDGRTVAITHAGVIRAAIVQALGAPIGAFWRLDADPLSLTELHARDGRWTVTRANCPLPGSDAL
jgi:broad specificity phosphatase PhoE